MASYLYIWIKAAHVLAIIALYCGLMYLPRLFVNQFRTVAGSEADTLLQGMSRRLFKGICNPALIAVWLLGLAMLAMNPSLLTQGWFHVKLAGVVLVTGVHGFYARSVRQFSEGERPRSERFWRIMNEVPFLLLIVIVIMAVVKPGF